MSDRAAAEELLALAELLVEDQLSSDQLHRLEELVLGSPALAAKYAEYVSMHATLRLERGAPLRRPVSGGATASSLRDEVAAGAAECSTVRSAVERVTDAGAVSGHFCWGWYSGGLVAAALVCVAALAFVGFTARPKTIATLVGTQGCKWDAGTLPTELGAKLVAGRLRLAEGLATIEFINGVQVRLEGPADLELVSPMRCIVKSGQLLAHVPPAGKGFVVETPTSVLTDFGTEFGVSVGSASDAVVEVFEGRVDALHRQSGRTEHLLKGATFEFKQSEYSSLSPDDEHIMLQTGPPSPTGDWVRISTAQGRGGDAFVQAMPIPADRRSESLLLVKQPIAEMPEWERRAYMAFDLSNVSQTRIQAAELTLTFEPSGFGFASLVPDATFEVYGVTDETLDDWREDTLAWDNAPAGNGVGKPLDGRRCRLLGSFVLPQGEQSCTRQLRGPELVDFLNADTNRLVTLIVLRKTRGTGRSDLVHGIVSRRHPSLSPPTLRLNLGSP